MADIEAGVKTQGLPFLVTLAQCTGNCTSGYTSVVDRGKAIRMAVDYAGGGDVVYIAGKGHENYQIVGNERIAFDDRIVAAEALERRKQKEQGKQ